MPRKRTESTATTLSKSQAVRDYLAEHPRAKPKEISSAVKTAHGLDISRQMISTIKTKWRRTNRGRGRPAGAAGKVGRPRASEARITIEDLVSAKKLASQMGGVERAQAALAALARLA